jgi:hypothetical protein
MDVHWMVLYKLYVCCSGMKFKMAATAGLNTKSCCSRHFEFHTGTKNVKFVEDHPMNIHVQFDFKHWILWENVQMPSSQKLQM